MKRNFRAFLVIGAASAGLAACTDQPTSAPTAPRMAGVNPDVLPTCNFTTLRDAVRSYADVNGSDVIFQYIRDMSTDAYGQGMNGLARLADIRANGPRKAGAGAAEGAAAAIQFLVCMPVGTLDADIVTHLEGAFASGGLFEVPATTSLDPVFSRHTPAVSQFWAAKPEGATTWGALSGGVRYVVFGYPIPGGFDYNVIPALGEGIAPNAMPGDFTGSLLIGACGEFANNVRVKHVDEVLFDESMAFCQPSSPTVASLSSGVGSFLASFVRSGLSMVTPQVAFAFGGGVGGAVSELSPTTLPTVVPKLEYAPQPANNKAVGDQLGIQVRVYTGASWMDGTPLNNADVTLMVAGNMGQDALFFDPTTGKACFQVTRTTVDGVADFSTVSVRKAGGYTLIAAADFDNLDANAVLSNLFNVKNKKVSAAPSC